MSAYELWHEYKNVFPKSSRYSLGIRIDDLFFETIEPITRASFSSKEEKLPYVKQAITKLDILKFFLQFAWTLHALDNKKFITLSEILGEVGKMLGGWKGQLQRQLNENSPMKGEK